VASIEVESNKYSSITYTGTNPGKHDEKHHIESIRNIPNAYERSIEFRNYLFRKYISLKNEYLLTMNTEYIIANLWEPNPKIEMIINAWAMSIMKGWNASNPKNRNKKKYQKKDKKCAYYVGKYEKQVTEQITPCQIQLITKYTELLSKTNNLQRYWISLLDGLFLSLTGK